MDLSRCEIAFGKENVALLKEKSVMIIGVGGVGGYVAEMLTRTGLGKIGLVDYDTIEKSNLNRQIIATHKTLGMSKVEVAKQRILDINPNAKIEIRKEFFTKESEEFIDKTVDYIIDCIDTVSSKIELILRAKNLDIPIISSMGTGNKLDPTKFEITDIYKTSVCPLAKVMRKELKNRGIDKLKVVYSKEEPIKIKQSEEEKCKAGSISFVPSVAGLIISGEVIKDLIN